MAKVSRLWRRLGLTSPLFNVWSEEDSEFQMTDHHIKAITITRGSANGTFGEQEHTLEVNSAVVRHVRTDRPIHCDLTSSGRDRLQSIIGGDGDNYRRRFFGRIGRQSVEDGGGISTDRKWHTNIYASKWQSQLKNSDRVGNQIDGEPVMYLFDHFMRPTVSNLPYLPDPEFPSNSWEYGTMLNNLDLGQAKITYSEFSSRYFEAPGFYVQNTRAGADRVLTIQRRWDLAQYRLESFIPLTRSQVLAPALWDQPNENRPRNHTVIYKNVSGDWLRRTRGPDTNDVRIPLVEHDISYIGFPSIHQPTQMLEARYAQDRTDTGYQLPTVEVDLLRLITSGNQSDRQQARQLLELEMGDPIYLSGDWATNIRGIHFASGVTEKITPDSWTLTLSLQPSISVIGYWSPTVPARVWDSAHVWWDNATSQWNERFSYTEGN